MAKWITPVTDRTDEDVAFARDKIQEWITAQTAVTYDLKGCLGLSDLNRIEGDIAYLNDQLNHYGYYVRAECKTDWTEWDWPTQGQIDRIRGNVSAMIASFCKLQGSPDIRYWDSLDWQDANSLEQNLANLDEAIRLMVDGFRRSGTFAAGQDFAL